MWSRLFPLILAKICHSFVVLSVASETNPSIIRGSKYGYTYESHVQSKVGTFSPENYQSASRHLSLKIDAKLAVTLLWHASNESILSIEVSNLGALAWYGQKSPINVANLPDVSSRFLVKLDENRAELYSIESDVNILNFQKALASLFIIRQENGQFEEQDILGSCLTKYSQDHHGLHKVKEMCQSGPNDDQRLLGTRQYSNVKSLYKIQDSGMIDHVEVREWLEFYHHLIPEVAQDIQHRQTLTLIEQLVDDNWSSFEADGSLDAIKAISLILQQDFKPHDLKGVVESKKAKPKKLKSLVTTLKKHLKTKVLATKHSAQAFIKLLGAIDHASKEDITELFKGQANDDIMPQLMDIAGMSSNEAAHEVVLEKVIDPSKTGRIDLFERYAFALCQSTKVHQKVFEKLFNIAQKAKTSHDKISQTLTLTVASLSRKVEADTSKAAVMKWLVTSLLKCKSPECHQHHLRALKNTQSSTVIGILMQLIESQEIDKKSALLSLDILAKFDGEVVKSKVKHLGQHLLTLIKDPTRDLSVKSTAIEMVLKNYPRELYIQEIIKILKESSSKELLAIVLQKWTELAMESPTLIEQLRKAIKKGWLNWNMLSHGGLSTSFSRQLGQNLAGNCSFTFNLEVSGKLMKRSHFELNFLQENGIEDKIIELGIYAGGLSSFVSNDEATTKEDDAEANAGMVLNVLGNQLRPITFFSSMSELMSLYWSGATEEKNSALQGNLLLQNGHFEQFLSNGLYFVIDSKGAISFDLSGQAKISMWTKQSESVVLNSLAYLMEQSSSWKFLTTDQPFSQKTELHTKIGVNLENNVDFGGSKVLTCIKMSQPEMVLNQETSSKLGKLTVKNMAKKTIYPRTLFLNDKNNELCNQMYPKKK